MKTIRLLVLPLAVMFATATLGQTTGAPLTAHSVARLVSVAGADTSPDGSLVAYQVVVPGPADQTAYVELRVVETKEGATPRTFIGGTERIIAPKFSPDGRSIYFLARRGSDTVTALWRIALDGGEARVVAKRETSITSFAISPDGAMIAVTSERPAPKATSDAKKAGYNQIVYEEDWQPVEMALIDAATGQGKTCSIEGTVYDPAFSPDGGSIAFWLAPTPSVDDSYMKKQLFIFDVAAGKARQVTTTPGKVGSFAFSPSGKTIAFSAAGDVHDPAVSTLFVVPAAGGEAKALTPADWNGHVVAPDWLDEDNVLFLADVGCEAGVFKQSASGGAIETAMATGSGAWTAFSYCQKNGHVTFVGSKPTAPPEVYTFRLGDKAFRQLTNSNPSLAQTPLAKQEVIRYPARDGLEIEGVLIWPLDYKIGQTYPLIVVVHGGPEAHNANGWLTNYSNPGQVGAARGYFVFYPNYRASTGRGVAFSKLDFGKLAEAEFDDLVDGVEFLAGSGLVDKTKVGVTGGSYGGYASAWCATKLSKHFAASVMFVGISNQISKRGTTDIPAEDYLVHWGIWPHENWQKMLESSPVYWIQEAKTPILICHGKDDPRVSVTQSMELYRALKNKGDVPVRLVLYPGEGHGNRRGGSRLDYSLRQMQWFDHFIMKGEKTPPPFEINYAE